jgi:hypothetical protein
MARRDEPLDEPDARPVQNRAGWRKGYGEAREWMIPPEVWKKEVCASLDATFAARAMEARFVAKARRRHFPEKRAYVLMADIIEGGADAF